MKKAIHMNRNIFNERFPREIKGRSSEEEIVSWQHVQNMREPHFTNASEEPWTWTNNSLEDDTRLMVFKFFCAMDNTHHLDYIVLTCENKMKKIGQYPSVADLSFPELKEYRKVMIKEVKKKYDALGQIEQKNAVIVTKSTCKIQSCRRRLFILSSLGD